MRVVVCDTGPLLHLEEAQALALIAHLGEVYIPSGVALELENNSPGWQSRWSGLVKVVSLAEKYQRQADRWLRSGQLDYGEAQAVALVQQLQANWLLTDDSAARQMAHRLSVEAHGSLGVVIWAAKEGFLDQSQAEVTLDKVIQSSLWLNEKVRRRAKALLWQVFSGQRQMGGTNDEGDQG